MQRWGNMSRDTRWLLLLCLTQLFIMLVFINYSAVLPLLKEEWRMNNTKAGSIFSVYQLGYILSGVILSTLADRFSIRKIFIISAIWSGCANLLFALFAHDYSSAMIFRALTGIGMGGTYMPGLKLVAERFDSSKRGRAIGIYVGSLVLGASLSLLVTGTIASFSGWRTAFIACSAGVFAGVLMSFRVFEGYQPTRFGKMPGESYMKSVVKNRPAMLLILGYGSHMWEMYGMRSWLAPFFTASLIQYGLSGGKATGWGALASALVVGIGAFSTAFTGSLSDKIGRTKTVTLVMIASAAFSFLFGWLVNLPPWFALAAGLVYGYLIVAESPVFSTGLTELVTPAYLGAAMGMQSLVGYSLGMISPTVFGWALDICKGWEPLPGISGEWGVGFATCGLGAVAGPVFMYLLRKESASSRMASGKK
jgi:MFS family permease